MPGVTRRVIFPNNSTDLWRYRRRWYDNTCTEQDNTTGLKTELTAMLDTDNT